MIQMIQMARWSQEWQLVGPQLAPEALPGFQCVWKVLFELLKYRFRSSKSIIVRQHTDECSARLHSKPWTGCVVENIQFRLNPEAIEKCHTTNYILGRLPSEQRSCGSAPTEQMKQLTNYL